MENSNIPLVKSNKIADDLENLGLDDLEPRGKTRPMTANVSCKLLIFISYLSIEKKRTFSGVPAPSHKGNPGIKQDSRYQKSMG